MSQPPAYVPVHAFVADSATLANFPGQALDVEFQDIKTTTDAIRANLALVQRDDGGLANNVVTYDSLSVSLQGAGLQPAVAWSTGVTFAVSANVLQSSNLYRCLVAHTSGVFATDLAAGKWVLVGALTTGPTGPTGPANTLAIGTVTSGAAAATITGSAPNQTLNLVLQTGSSGGVGATGSGYGGTSATSLLIANSVSKTFTTQAGLAYQVGSYVRASSAANGANFMEGLLSSYSGTTLIISVSKIGGSGTFADWTFAVSGAPGLGDVVAANNLSDLAAKYTAKDNISVHGADVASATTTNLETATGDCIDVTGTTTITAITLSEGHERTVRFTGILTLTNGASLILPGGTNIITAAGDYAVFRGYAAGVVRCVSYQIFNAYEEVATTISSASPFALTTGGSGVVWNTVAIPRAGLWEVGGNSGVMKTGGTTPVWTHMHADHNNTAATVIQTAPGNGSTVAQHVTSNNENGWLLAHSPIRYRTTGAVTINFVMTADFTGGTGGAYGRSYAVRVAP